MRPPKKAKNRGSPSNANVQCLFSELKKSYQHFEKCGVNRPAFVTN